MKDVVIEHETQFVLPEGHTLQVSDDGSTITLHTGGGGGTYELLGLRETDAEVIYRVGSARTVSSVGAQPTGYPFVAIQDEMDRMQREWESLGGEVGGFNAWAPGEDHNGFLTRRRGDLRDLRSGS